MKKTQSLAITGIGFSTPNNGGASGPATEETVITLWNSDNKQVFSKTVKEILNAFEDSK